MAKTGNPLFIVMSRDDQGRMFEGRAFQKKAGAASWMRWLCKRSDHNCGGGMREAWVVSGRGGKTVARLCGQGTSKLKQLQHYGAFPFSSWTMEVPPGCLVVDCCMTAEIAKNIGARAEVAIFALKDCNPKCVSAVVVVDRNEFLLWLVQNGHSIGYVAGAK